MFLYDKFCHCASNERWEKQGAVVFGIKASS